MKPPDPTLRGENGFRKVHRLTSRETTFNSALTFWSLVGRDQFLSIPGWSERGSSSHSTP